MRADRTLLAGVFLICFANMLLEVVITRLFSATMFYHFTFLAVALALFGIAASGVYVFVAGERLAVDVRGEMARATRRFAIGALITVAYAMANPMDIIIVTGGNAIRWLLSSICQARTSAPATGSPERASNTKPSREFSPQRLRITSAKRLTQNGV